MEELDRWVKTRGNGKYPPKENYTAPFGLPEIYGIQQNREELLEFVAYLLGKGGGGTVLEIGLGRAGSTHVLWRQIFDLVITIELDFERVNQFGTAFSSFYGVWPDERSRFIFGDSHALSTFAKTRQCAKQVDMVFIDGDHGGNAARADWSLYAPLVKKGGIVAFHEAAPANENAEVVQFLKELESEQVDGTPHALTRIVKSGNQGIAYYIK